PRGACKRRPQRARLPREAGKGTAEGPLAEFAMTEKDRYELKIAGLLHDCGKVTTPVHVVDKATKLETIFDRINLVDTRFEILKRDLEIGALRRKFDLQRSGGDAAREQSARVDDELRDALRKL